MSIQQKVPELLQYIQSYSNFTEKNHETLDIFNGNLSEYVLRDLQSILSDNYYQQIKDRIIPINVLTRVMNKLSKVYAYDVIRTTEKEADQEILDFYVKQFQMDKKGNYADEYSNMFKGYAFEPFIHNGTPKLRTLPFDKFLPYSDDAVDPTHETIFIKFLGKRTVAIMDKRVKGGYRNESKEVYFAFSEEEFYAFDEDGNPYLPAIESNEGTDNYYGIIPFVYGNRGRDELVPTQDSDILRISKVIPIILSDVSGAIMFQCFSIIWGVDLDLENATLSPNAIWDLKSDDKTDNKPQIGTIKPEADIDKVVSFVMDIFVMWLETKGIRVGSVGQISGSNFASGISKIIDEMDTTEIRKVAIEEFEHDEKEFWNKMKVMHNFWVDNNLLEGWGRFSDDFEVMIEFDEPEINTDEQAKFDLIERQVNAGFKTPEQALKELYPDMDETQLAEQLQHYEEWNSVNAIENNDIIDTDESTEENVNE